MSYKTILSFLLCLVSASVFAQDWNKKKCAVVLTYDDALNVHLDKVVPALDSLDLKGTFYLTAASGAFTQRLPEWRKVAANQHELANHTLFHPCDGTRPNRTVKADYNLATYSVRRITDEIKMANAILEAVDGKKEHTFAYPCGDTQVAGASYIDGLKGNLVAARGTKGVYVQNKPTTDLYNIGSFMINGKTGDELIAMVKKAMETNSMVVFLFHGVGGEHALNVSLEAHRQLIQFLKQNEKDIWNTTFMEAAKHMRATSSVKK